MADKHSRFKSEIEHGSIPYSGKFSRVQIFAIWLPEPSAEIFVGSNIRVSMPVYPSFNFRVNYSALEKREILHLKKISRYTEILASM